MRSLKEGLGEQNLTKKRVKRSIERMNEDNVEIGGKSRWVGRGKIGQPKNTKSWQKKKQLTKSLCYIFTS